MPSRDWATQSESQLAKPLLQFKKKPNPAAQRGAEEELPTKDTAWEIQEQNEGLRSGVLFPLGSLRLCS